MRLIDAEALKTDIVENSITLEGVMAIETDCAKVLIDNAPTVEERPQGKWITIHKQNSFGQDCICFECDKCHKYKVPIYTLMSTEQLDVCPNCGADMRDTK